MRKTYAVWAFLICVAIKSHAAPFYPAQILGRDLGIPGLAWAGHVGLTLAKQFSDTAEHVIEVLNEVEVIQVNTISHFKQATRYWGGRFGIADHTPAADLITKEALRQRALCPIYTDSATYHVGEGTPNYPTRCAVFRCDTFINYLFHQAGFNLPTHRGTTLPRLVFKAFPYSHHDGSIQNQNPTAMRFEQFKTTFDLPKHQATPAHLQKVWTLAKDPSLSTQKRLFLLDYLGLNGSPELIDALIKAYPKQTHPDIKSMMIRSTFTLYQAYFLNQPHPSLQQFYANLLYTELQAKDLPFVIRGLATLTPPQLLKKYQSRIIQQLKQHQNKLPHPIQQQLHELLQK